MPDTISKRNPRDGDGDAGAAGAVRVSNETWTAVSQDGNVINEGEPSKYAVLTG